MRNKKDNQSKSLLDFILQHESFRPKLKYRCEKTIGELNTYLPEEFLPHEINEVPQNYILNLYPFFEERPQKFYKEEIFNSFVKFHLDYFRKNNGVRSIFSDSYVRSNFTEGWFKLKKFNKEVNETELDNVPREEKFRTYVCPWYAHRLCEDIYDNLITLPLKCLERKKRKNYLELSVT